MFFWDIWIKYSAENSSFVRASSLALSLYSVSYQFSITKYEVKEHVNVYSSIRAIATALNATTGISLITTVYADKKH